jgi:hypothetical protein
MNVKLGTLFYKGVKFERGKNWSHKKQVFSLYFSCLFLFAIIQFSNRKIPMLRKYWAGHWPPLPPPPKLRLCNSGHVLLQRTFEVRRNLKLSARHWSERTFTAGTDNRGHHGTAREIDVLYHSEWSGRLWGARRWRHSAPRGKEPACVSILCRFSCVSTIKFLAHYVRLCGKITSLYLMDFDKILYSES